MVYKPEANATVEILIMIGQAQDILSFDPGPEPVPRSFEINQVHGSAFRVDENEVRVKGSMADPVAVLGEQSLADYTRVLNRFYN